MKSWILTATAAATASLLMAVSSAQAVPVTWSFHATFGNGGTASGSFVYDASNGANGTYSAVDIFTSAAHYSSASGSSLPNFFSAVSDNGSFEIVFGLSAALTDNGGVVALVPGPPSGESECVPGTDCSQNGPPNEIIDGQVSATPIPGAIPLFASGLGVLGLMTWRRKRAAAAA